MISFIAASAIVCANHATTPFGEVTVTLERSEHHLKASIQTKRLYMRSLTIRDLDSYAELFGDPEVMTKYSNGKTKSFEDTAKRVNLWVDRWKKKDPYSSLAIIKKETNEFIGHVVLGYSEYSGRSELTYLFLKTHWKQGYGNEAVYALVHVYAPLIVQEGYLVKGIPLAEIIATARYDNIGSIKILENIGMQCMGEIIKFGNRRYEFSIRIFDLMTAKDSQ